MTNPGKILGFEALRFIQEKNTNNAVLQNVLTF